MQINSYSLNFTPNFKAIRTAQIQSRIAHKPATIDLFKITKEDRPFLVKFLVNTSFKTLCPQLAEYARDRWQKIFNYCIDCALENENTTYIALSENKPCGILTYQKDTNTVLDGICAIPNENGEKVPFSGLSLFYQFFLDNLSNKTEGIDLEAITDGPFNVVKKYEQLGFKQEGFINQYIKMHCNKFKIKEQLQKLSSLLDYTETEPEKTDLNIFLN